MKTETDPLGKGLQDLFNQSAEASKNFISEGTKFMKQLDFSNISGNDIFTGRTELMKETVDGLLKLNIRHASDLLNLGIEFSKKFYEPINAKVEVENEEPIESKVPDKPSFVLQTTCTAGETANALFLLDSSSKDVVVCTLNQSDYQRQDDAVSKDIFETIFIPQSFEIKPGQSQKVDIRVKIPSATKPGIYKTDIVADGFPHTYFSLFVTVELPIAQGKARKSVKK